MKMTKEKSEELIEIELKMKDNFIRRHGDALSDSSMREVLEAYVRWRHRRYAVVDFDEVYLVQDMYNPEHDPVAVLNKDLDPMALDHAYIVAEELNDLPDDYISIDGKVIPIDDFDLEPKTDIFSFEPKTNLVDFGPLGVKSPKTMFSDDYMTIDEVINKATEILDQKKEESEKEE